MVLYDELLRTVLSVRHRKDGGYYLPLPHDIARRLRVMEGAALDVAIMRVFPPQIEEEKET